MHKRNSEFPNWIDSERTPNGPPEPASGNSFLNLQPVMPPVEPPSQDSKKKKKSPRQPVKAKAQLISFGPMNRKSDPDSSGDDESSVPNRQESSN